MADDDYDFFDEPVASDTPKYTSFKKDTSDNSSIVGSGVKSITSNRDDHNSTSPRPEERYSDSFTDESDTEQRDNVKSSKIEARVPSATKHKHRNESKSDSYYSSDDSLTDADSNTERKSTHKDKNKQHSSSDRSFSETESLSASDTDSDVTDVSPIHSPKRGYREATKTPNQQDNLLYKSGSSSRENIYKDLFENGTDKMNLEILMQAVREMENTRQGEDYMKNERIAKSRRVLFVPQRATPQNRKNYSFSNDKVSVIDRENQRLMEKIVKFTADASKVKKKVKSQTKPLPTKMTPSAVNRLREQQRIERENLAMLKRLQKTKATQQIQRDNLLMDYEKKTIAGQSVAAAHYEKESPYSLTMINKRSKSINDLDLDRASVTLKSRRQYSHQTYEGTAGIGKDPATVKLQTKQSRPVSASAIRSDISGMSNTKSYNRRRPHSAHIGHSTSTSYVGRYQLSSKKPDWDSTY